eukprot:766817-Hanusia_phi.AAC.4
MDMAKDRMQRQREGKEKKHSFNSQSPPSRLIETVAVSIIVIKTIFNYIINFNNNKITITITIINIVMIIIICKTILFSDSMDH